MKKPQGGYFYEKSLAACPLAAAASGRVRQRDVGGAVPYGGGTRVRQRDVGGAVPYRGRSLRTGAKKPPPGWEAAVRHMRLWPLMESLNCIPKNSAALRHRSMRCMKISK